ncbi:MAG: PspC domain-containing protein [Flavobacterium sp.]|nr:PspC domain-containing protein [Flavobacterium sp.]
MNKTVNINIGGLFFHIDEDAYQKLSRYFEAIKRSLSNSSGKDEIMKDIEMRVAELLTEKQKSVKHVVNNNDVDEVVTVMGQPEDYRLDVDDELNKNTDHFKSRNTKVLYRDKDRGSIAGVCSGLSYYFGIDVTWIKIAFLATAFAGFGFGIIIYIILWIATPEAVTTSEKLEMRGEPVTISTIEKKVREEFDNVSQNLRNVNYDELGNKVKSATEHTGKKLGSVFISLFSVFAKILGAMIVFFSALSLLGICIASVILMFSSSLPQNTIINNIATPIGLETPLWIQGILFLLTFGIPLFFMLYLGLKLMVSNLKSISNIIKYSLLAIWIIALGVLISLGINELTQISSESKDVQKEIINIASTDTLFVKFKTNDFYDKDVNHRTDFRLTQDEQNNKVIYSNNIYLKILQTSEKNPYLQVEKLAVGKSPQEAKTRAKQIKYSYKIIGNQLILDNYLLSNVASKFRNQKVELYLYLPVGTLLKTDTSVEDYDESDNDYFNLHFSSDKYVYKVFDNQIKCLNCPINENEDYNDVELNQSKKDSVGTIQLNSDGILIKKSTIKNDNNKIESINIDKNGVIIKTK